MECSECGKTFKKVEYVGIDHEGVKCYFCSQSCYELFLNEQGR